MFVSITEDDFSHKKFTHDHLMVAPSTVTITLIVLCVIIGSKILWNLFGLVTY